MRFTGNCVVLLLFFVLVMAITERREDLSDKLVHYVHQVKVFAENQLDAQDATEIIAHRPQSTVTASDARTSTHSDRG